MTKSKTKSKTKPKTNTKTKTKISIKNKKGGGDPYSSDDYKDVGVLDGLKFKIDDFKTPRQELPPFPGCSIM
jgi:hypothetical protein